MMQKTLSAEKRQLKNADPIAELGDEEDEVVKNQQNSLTLPVTKKGLGATPSNLNLMEGNLSAREEEFQSALFYKYVECQYLISVLKHKSVQAKEVQNESFDDIYKKARKTLKH